MSADLADLADWHDEHLLDHRRRLRTAMFLSFAVHGLVFALFAVSPPMPMHDVQEFIAVELVGPPPAAAPARSAPKSASAPKAPAPPPPPAPAAEPTPPAPAPPVAKSPVQVLPEETPGRIREVKPEPEVVAKVEKKPVVKPPPAPPVQPKRPPKEKALSFEDAMAALEDELGVDETASLLAPRPSPDAKAAAESAEASAAAARPGITVTPEQAAWDREVSRMIRERLPNFARYRGLGLVSQLQVVVSATGELSGEPRLLRTSGDLDFDRMAIAAVERAAPLPAPPSPGVRRLDVTSE